MFSEARPRWRGLDDKHDHHEVDENCEREENERYANGMWV